MKKNLFNPILKLYVDDIEKSYVALIVQTRNTLLIKAFSNEYQCSYCVNIEETDIDKSYVFSLRFFRELMSKVKAVNQFVIKDNIVFETNKSGNVIERSFTSINHIIPDNIADFDVSIFTEPENLLYLKKHERHKVELKKYPELNNLMIRQDENNNLLFYSTNGYSILETTIPVSGKILNNQYYASPVFFKNLDLSKLGIKKYEKDIEIGLISNCNTNNDAKPSITFIISDAGIYTNFSYTVFMNESSIKLETMVNSTILKSWQVKLNPDFNVKNLNHFVVRKNKKEAKNNKYRVSFSIKDEYIMDGDELVMPIPKFPDIKIINGYDLLEIIDGEISVQENDSLIGLCSNNQRLLLKKANF